MVQRSNAIATAVLVLLCLACALAVAFLSHTTRQRYAYQEQLRQRYEALQVIHGQLLLERGAWTRPAFLQEQAVKQLNMVAPDAQSIELIHGPLP